MKPLATLLLLTALGCATAPECPAGSYWKEDTCTQYTSEQAAATCPKGSTWNTQTQSCDVFCYQYIGRDVDDPTSQNVPNPCWANLP